MNILSYIGHRVAATGAVAVLAGAGALAAAPAAAAAELPQGKVVSRVTLSIRSEPTSKSTFLGGFAPGTVVPLYCKTHGQKVDGNDLWYPLGGPKPGWVAARYVKNLAPAGYCN
ncbi:SH3 domain-containing protein [Actinacidiphila oryziradicis]|uniref:SH3 domain-containing protein n=1 Tax=Actinacidiphila oryziradicis TaxID=2571141 RepID=A0A4U0T0C3_9ACTN|nr:SH3 domain-containing protein [Actinacidiphila oryziradicis]TKA06205.1 SH3 domain-containing protein [Actinacidiphila oryziradicis]